MLGGVAIFVAVMATLPAVRAAVAPQALGGPRRERAAVRWSGWSTTSLHLKPYQKLIGQIIGARGHGRLRAWCCRGPARRRSTWLITLVWLVGITNAVNLLDNMDGLAAGIAAIAAAFLG